MARCRLWDRGAPSIVRGVDASEAFISRARASILDHRARFDTAVAEDLPFEEGIFDIAVSALLLNFVSKPLTAVREMGRVVRSGVSSRAMSGTTQQRCSPLRHFWDAVLAVVDSAAELEEVRRFALCKPGPLRALFADAGLREVEVQPIASRARFHDFEDYWSRFLAGRGAAPAYLMSLPEQDRLAVEKLLCARLARDTYGPLELITRAWSVRGRQ